MITIGIPSRGINDSLHRVIRHALTLDVEQIIVGINPDQHPSTDLSCYKDSRLRIHEHNRDLGLYGNFHFLVSQAHTDYFAWLCTDDLFSSEIPAAMKSMHGQSVDLFIPSWKWVEYNPGSEKPFISGTEVEGTYPDLSTKETKARSGINCEPSWIFGVWKTSFLQEVFPNQYFDWLDAYILQRTLLTGKVTVIELKNPTVIGTWKWAGKIPSFVSGHGHNPWNAIKWQLKLLPKLMLVNPSLLFEIVMRIRFLVVSSRVLNRQLKDRKLGE